jgi:hypothetical protein
LRTLGRDERIRIHIERGSSPGVADGDLDVAVVLDVAVRVHAANLDCRFRVSCRVDERGTHARADVLSRLGRKV